MADRVADPVALDDVCVRYADGIAGLTSVSLALAPGLCALLGPNGAGKSTLIRAIAGVVPIERGQVHIFGRPLAELGREERARNVAVVPQQSEVAFGFTVRDVVQMGRAPHQGAFMRERREDRDAVGRALADCELEGLAERPVAALSGGEQQRVHIARALAQEAPILLLDEAAAHLDVRHTVALYRLLEEQIRTRGLTCLAAMHDFNAALRHADRAVVLCDGRVLGAGPSEEILRPALLSKAFGVVLVSAALPGGGTVLVADAPESRPDDHADL